MSERILSRLSEIADESRDLAEELEALSELEELDDEQEARFDELTGDDSPIHDLRAERAKLEKRMNVIKAARDASDRGEEFETGEDRSFQFKKQVETKDVDPLRGSRSEVRDAALKMLETEHDRQTAPVSDASAAHIEKMIRTKNRNLDGDLIARRLLVTESPAYRSAFAKSLHPNPAYTQDEVAAVNQFRATEQSLTDASGGFGVPVKVAA